MTSPDDAVEKTRSLLATAAANAGVRRLLAIWDGGYATCGLPESGEVVLGRGQTADLRISVTSVSREHALVRTGQSLTIEDLGSSNGTRVDGQRLQPGQRAPLSVGRVVELGDVVLVLQDPANLAQSSAPAAAEQPAGAMARLYRLADLVAAGTLSVVLQGETGVGKELLAKRIHERSPRALQPFLKLNCAAFAEPMVESELFGYERGAFTGANHAKPGLLESASGGTVLLDEVAELSPAMQAKLLRAIGNSEVLRVGSVKPRLIDVRFLAASNRELLQLAQQGSFRSDLYFRLNGVTLTIPALRERRDEIAALAREFLGSAASRLSSAGIAWLERQAWPGNVRELKSAVERASLLAAGGPIDVQHLELEPASALAPAASSTARRPAATPDLRGELELVERARIADAMARSGGNQTKAAGLLGISRRALIHRLDAYELPRPRKGT